MVKEQDLMDDLEQDQEDDFEDEKYMDQEEQNEFPQGYGVPEPEPQFNQHAFIAASLSQPQPEKVTYLQQGELGIPAFTIRFMQDMEDIAKYYLDPILKKYSPNDKNRVSDYFRQKIINVSDSGMSNQGFIQSMNVTKKMDMQRTRTNNINNLKGGKR